MRARTSTPRLAPAVPHHPIGSAPRRRIQAVHGAFGIAIIISLLAIAAIIAPAIAHVVFWLVGS